MKETFNRWLAALRTTLGTRPGATTLSAAAIDLNRLYDSQTEAVMKRVLDRRSSAIDVGCHKGEILDVMLRLAPEGTHFAFEPLPHLFAALALKYAGVANVRLHEVALSESPGKAAFQHVVTNSGYSGLLRRRYDRPNEKVVTIKVRVEKLDDVLPADAAVRFMKIDVEGAELQVLRGGIATLRRSRPFIVFEHGLGGSDCYGTRPEHVYDLLAACRLRISLMGDWLESEGEKALSREAFAEQFDKGLNYYFLAHP